MAHKVLALLALLAISTAKEQTRWSRQISSYTSDISDWVPLSAPVEKELPQIKRQAVAEPRILSEPFLGFVRPTGFSQDNFPSRAFYNSPANRQLYLQSVPSAPQNYLSDQGFGQGLRFGLTQPNFPLSQGFIAPQFNYDAVPQIKHRPQSAVNPIKFENSVKTTHAIPSPVKPFLNVHQAPKTQPEMPKFIDGYRVENSSDYNFAKKKLPSQKVKFEDSNKSKEVINPKSKVEREEVQLLYVPLESLNRGQFNFRSPLSSAQLVNSELYDQGQRPNPLVQNFADDFQRPVSKPMETINSQEFLTNFNSQFHEMKSVPKFSAVTNPFPTTAPTTPKPKKLKPHQPPLAIFLTQEAKKEDDVKVGDVLYSLKSADTVAVLDSVNPLNAPKVFIGPSSLTPPEKYVKFELPYLSNIENIDKKLRQLPFFVAPLSYKTPQGFAKIPFPSPHVGSVVINSQIKDTSSQIRTTTTSNVYNNPYAGPTLYRQEQKPVTQSPKISYYSTSSPNVNTPNYEQNYYSIEPQSVNTLRPLKEQQESVLPESSPPIKSNAYYPSNLGTQYKAPQFFPKKTDYNNQEPIKHVDYFTRETTTQRTTVTPTTKPSSTYPSQLLETHNPYSINQAFHFSTPLDHHNLFEEHKDAYVTPGAKPVASSSNPETPSTTTPTAKFEETYQTQSYKPTYQSSPNYLQSYTPEIHNEYENQNLRYPVFNINDYLAKTETTPQTELTNSNQQTSSNVYTEQVSNLHLSENNNKNIETQSPTYDNYTDFEKNVPEIPPNENNESTKSSSEYNHYDIGYNYQELQTSTASSTTTTTRRNTVRTRGRPRYPTTKSDSGEYSTRASVVTRRPLRERKPLPVRPKYETNKLTTEKPIRKPFESNESTTRASRTRTRGRIHYRPADSDDIYSKRNRGSSKENDLAYQRDVLHQNYPVTLMERTSTVDIEAITEPSEKAISTNNVEISKTYDTEDAYSNDKPTITEPVNIETKDLPDQYTTALDSASDSSYVSKVPSQDEQYSYQSQNVSPQDVVVSNNDAKDDNYSLQTSPEHKIENQDDLYATRPASPVTEQNIPIYSINDQFQPEKQEDITLPPEGEANAESQTQETKQEQEENIVETTPSYNRVRIRPGVIRQYHQQSSDSSRLNNERRKPLQTITYRPAFDKHRTTMRIEEIEADLKTKQVHTRPEYLDYKQPVYKPEPTTESVATSSTTEPSTRRGQFRRRRPTYSSSTESTVTRRTYEVKNRFRGRRPTEKPTEKPENQVDVSTTTVKNNLYSRYRDRPRLSERYNKKPETEDQGNEDQDSNYSINRPKYAEPESERWSPKISRDSFKPYNPNNIADDTKVEINREKSKEEELDIITAKNEYEDILISVTPATNNRAQKKIPDIPPTLEALVEQTKVTKSDSSDSMSTFESMLEEVMKSLEEQDENEYTGNVMKHKGGEIGEIPPERIISSGENYSFKSTTPLQEEVTTPPTDAVSSPNISEEVPPRQNRRRGFWKKVRKVRPASDEIEVAESQYYSNVVNRLGQTVEKGSGGKSGKGNVKVGVTTYKPNYQFLKDFFDTEEEEGQVDVIPNIEIPKITAPAENKTEHLEEFYATTKAAEQNENDSSEIINPGDMDLGTGSPDPTLVDDNIYYTDPTEATTSIDRSDRLSFMDYLFGETSENIGEIKNESIKLTQTTPIAKIEIPTEASKLKATTESAFIPEEFTAEAENENVESVTEIFNNIQRVTIDDNNQEVTEKSVKVETSSVSSFMNPANVVSTSMSTEVSHETEICFRGKCIKTNRNLL